MTVGLWKKLGNDGYNCDHYYTVRTMMMIIRLHFAGYVKIKHSFGGLKTAVCQFQHSVMQGCAELHFRTREFSQCVSVHELALGGRHCPGHVQSVRPFVTRKLEVSSRIATIQKAKSRRPFRGRRLLLAATHYTSKTQMFNYKGKYRMAHLCHQRNIARPIILSSK